MKIFQFFRLSLSVFISVILLTMNLNYAHQVELAEPVKVVSQFNRALDVTVVKKVDAVYPPLARAALVSSAVIVEIAIGGTGKVTSAKAISGHPLLKDASVAAARQWEFTPISLGEANEKVIGTITFDYIIPRWREELERAKLQAERNPDSPEAHSELATAHRSNGRFDEAIKDYEEVIRLKPDLDENIYGELALLYHRDENYKMKLETYQRGLKVFPGSVLLLKELGKAFADTGKYSEGIEMYQKALLVEPDNLGLLYDIAELYQNLLQFEESLIFLHKAIAIAPFYSAAQERAGFAYLQLGKLDEAEQFLKESVSFSAHSASALEYLGDVYQQKGNVDSAVQAWKKALSKTYEASQLARIEAKLKPYLK